jgi:hypothetical protein
MADYYGIIKRAIAALPNAGGEHRRAVYEKARTALVAQLKVFDPPLSASDITQQRLQLEDAIRKTETEFSKAAAADGQAGSDGQNSSSRDESLRALDINRTLTETVSKIGNLATGAKISVQKDFLGIDPSGEESDFQVSRDSVTAQLHEGILRRAKEFVTIANRINNQHGWTGIKATTDRLVQALSCLTEEIPSHLGTAYDAAIEIASYLEQDNQLSTSNQSDVDRLDADSRRSLANLVMAIAPWIRRFPTARLLDDDAGAFLARRELFEPTEGIIDAASGSMALKQSDIILLRALLAAWQRGEFQGNKAGARSLFTVRNIIAVVASVYLGAVGSVVAEKSTLTKKLGNMIVLGEDAITAFVAQEPIDVQLAIAEIIKRAKEDGLPQDRWDPAILPSTPREKRIR